MTKHFKYRLNNLSWLNASFLFLTPPAAITLTILWIYFYGFEWSVLSLGIFFYILSGISITAGYHRLFAHKAYEAHPIVKVFFLVFGAAAFQNSVLKWSADHRIHHKDVDTEQDPYNINEGFFYAHMGWIILKNNQHYNEKYVKDLIKDPLVKFQHDYYFPIAGFFGIILPTLISGYFFGHYLGGLAVAALLKVVVLHHSTFFINSLCHYIGKTPYTDSNTAKDSWLMALLTFGEGYHNFHHYFQTDYRNGIRWFQFDPTKWLIKFLEWMNLAKKLKKTPDFKILKARLQMKITEAKMRYHIDETISCEIEKLKDAIVDSMKKIEELSKEYKNEKTKTSKMKLLEIKHQLNLAKADFKYNLETFHLKLTEHTLAV